MDNLQYLKPGDPIRATMLNALIDGAKIAKNLSHTGAGTGAGAKHSNVLVRILNDTGGDLERFAVVAINEPIFEPENNDTAGSFFQEPAFRGTKMKTETKCFAVLQTPALQDEIVLGCVAGVSAVKIDVQNESDEFVTPKSGETIMKGNSEGVARIIWKESGTGEKWGLILFPVGAAGEKTQYAVTQTAIKCPPTPTLNDTNSAEFINALGLIRIVGKEYPLETDDDGEPIEGTEKFDYCACIELAGANDEFPEQIVKGRQVTITKGGTFDDPDFTPSEGNETPPKVTFYLAINTATTYNARLDTDVNAGEVTTITVQDSDKEEILFSVHADMAEDGTYWGGRVDGDGNPSQGTASSYDIERRVGGGFIVLQIVNGVCSMTEQPEEEEVPE